MSVHAPPAAPPASTDGYRIVTPAPPLQRYVECFWVHAVSGRSSALRLLPDGRMNIVWHAGMGLWLVGPQSRWFDRPLDGTFVALGVRFWPGAAPSLLRIPARDLTDDRVSLEAVDAALAARLERRLDRARFEDEAFAVFNEELSRQVEQWPERDTAVVEAVDLLFDSSVTVAEVADRVFVSERQLQRRFHEHVGYGPKTLQRVLRFQDAIDRLRDGAEPAAAAASAGYADQSHLFRESRRLAGLSPRDLVAAGH